LVSGKAHPSFFVRMVTSMQEFPEGMRGRDLFPLPIPSVTNEEEVWGLRKRGLKVAAQYLEFPDSILEKAASVKAWVFLLSHSLTFMYNRVSSEAALRRLTKWSGPPTTGQLECMTYLERLALSFVENTETIPSFCWDDFFSTHKLSYTAEIVEVAHVIDWSCIEPALPEKDMIGCVDLLDVCTGGIKEYLTNFDISLKDPKIGL
jgi:hypothetical protein